MLDIFLLFVLHILVWYVVRAITPLFRQLEAKATVILGAVTVGIQLLLRHFNYINF